MPVEKSAETPASQLSSAGRSAEEREQMAMNYSEQVCMGRCINKWIQGKQVIDTKIKGQI